jgi:hypothetical protein
MTNIEKLFKAIENLQPKTGYKIITHESDDDLVDEALFNNIEWTTENNLTWTAVKTEMDKL